MPSRVDMSCFCRRQWGTLRTRLSPAAGSGYPGGDLVGMRCRLPVLTRETEVWGSDASGSRRVGSPPGGVMTRSPRQGQRSGRGAGGPQAAGASGPVAVGVTGGRTRWSAPEAARHQ